MSIYEKMKSTAIKRGDTEGLLFCQRTEEVEVTPQDFSQLFANTRNISLAILALEHSDIADRNKKIDELTVVQESSLEDRLFSDSTKVIGQGHWSTGGDLNSEYWKWGVVFPAKDYVQNVWINDDNKERFRTKIKDILPINWADNLTEPQSIPGDIYEFSVLLSQIEERLKIHDLLRETLIPENDDPAIDN